GQVERRPAVIARREGERRRGVAGRVSHLLNDDVTVLRVREGAREGLASRQGDVIRRDATHGISVGLPARGEAACRLNGARRYTGPGGVDAACARLRPAGWHRLRYGVVARR